MAAHPRAGAGQVRGRLEAQAHRGRARQGGPGLHAAPPRRPQRRHQVRHRARGRSRARPSSGRKRKRKRALARRSSGREADGPAAAQQPRTNHNHRFESSSAAAESRGPSGHREASVRERARAAKPANQWSRQELDALFARRSAAGGAEVRARRHAPTPHPTRKPEHSRHGTSRTQAQNRASGIRAATLVQPRFDVRGLATLQPHRVWLPEEKRMDQKAASPLGCLNLLGVLTRRAVSGRRALRGRGRQVPRRHRDAARHRRAPAAATIARAISTADASRASGANAGTARSATMRPSRR